MELLSTLQIKKPAEASQRVRLVRIDVCCYVRTRSLSAVKKKKRCHASGHGDIAVALGVSSWVACLFMRAES